MCICGEPDVKQTRKFFIIVLECQSRGAFGALWSPRSWTTLLEYCSNYTRRAVDWKIF